MNRLMYDTTHDEVKSITGLVKPGDLVAGYVTGSSDIRWTSEDFNHFTQQPIVTIDQGFTGSPVVSAMVRDVEAGAWNAHDAITKPWTAARRTIYCARNTLTEQIIPGGWKGDVWLADPEPMPEFPPHYDGVKIVAVQFGFETTHDVSVVFDTNWPHLPAPVDILSVTGHAGYANFGWTFHDNVIKSELVVKGAGGAGTGTSYVDEFVPGTGYHDHLELAPGWYLAHVRGFISTNSAGPWSSWHKFLVTKPA